MKAIKTFGLFFVFSLLIQSSSFAAPDNQERRMAILEQQLQQSRKDVAALQESLSKLQESLAIDDLIKSFDLIAYLKADSSGYVNFRFDLGYLTMSIVDIQPYADGTKLVLRVGNPLYANINGISADIEWGD